LVGFARDAAIHHVKDAGAYNDEPCLKEVTSG
jgi:hypothetical protein